MPQKVVDRALEADPDAAAAEYLGQWRSDLASFVDRQVVEASVVANRFELPPLSTNRYFGFCDPSGGSSDDMTLAVAHKEGDRIIVDAVRAAKPPFSPENVVADFARVLKSYRVMQVRGDRYGGEWPRERFRVHGVHYEPAEKTRSDLYLELLPLLNAGRVDLLDHKRLVSQLCNLERRTARSGKDSIDYPVGQHDDVANAVAGAVVCAGGRRGPMRISDATLARSLERPGPSALSMPSRFPSGWVR